MTGVMEPLREEHRELLPHIEALRTAADAVGAVPYAELTRLVADAYEFLSGHLRPHAEAEEAALYPVVGRVLGSAGATATMSRDHVEVGKYIRDLDGLHSKLAAGEAGGGIERELRRVLYGLYAIVSLHFAKEEEVYVPALEAALSHDEVHALFAAMGHAAEHARH